MNNVKLIEGILYCLNYERRAERRRKSI